MDSTTHAVHQLGIQLRQRVSWGEMRCYRAISRSQVFSDSTKIAVYKNDKLDVAGYELGDITKFIITRNMLHIDVAERA